MARYKIYDNKSDVITPVGEKLTAEQWLDRYQWGRYTKMIVGGGIINGSVALVFDNEVERYRKAGCDFSACVTDEDYLAAIEAFEQDHRFPLDQMFQLPSFTPFMVREIRFFSRSTARIFTSTTSPTLTASIG